MTAAFIAAAAGWLTGGAQAQIIPMKRSHDVIFFYMENTFNYCDVNINVTKLYI